MSDYEEDWAELVRENTKLKAANIKLRSALMDAACYIGEHDMEFVEAMWRKAGITQQTTLCRNCKAPIDDGHKEFCGMCREMGCS